MRVHRCSPLWFLFLLALLLWAPVLYAQPVITSLTPARHATAASLTADVVLVWSQAMSTATLDNQAVRVFGSLGGLYSTNATYTLSAGDTQVEVNPVRSFHVGEQVMVSVTRATNTLGERMERLVVWSFTAPAQGGTGVVERGWEETESPRDTRSVVAADFDGDGDVDVFEGNFDQPNRLWRNDGTGNFTVGWEESGAGRRTLSVAAGDLDGDGRVDIFEGNYNQPNRLWKNDGAGGFSNTWSQYGDSTATQCVAVGDLDGDGDLDVFQGCYNQPNRVWRNSGAGNFAVWWTQTDSTATLCTKLSDVDNDGDLDVVEGGYFMPERVWANNGTGSFSMAWQDPGPVVNPTYDLVLGDIDGDGDADMVEGCYNGQNRVWSNDGSGVFTIISYISYGAWTTPYCLALGDLDGDGDPDLYEGTTAADSRVWINNGGVFSNREQPLIPARTTRSAVLADLNGDGALDIFEGNRNTINRVWLNARPPEVIETFPVAQAIGVDRATNISGVFNTSLRAQTVDFRVMGTRNGRMSGAMVNNEQSGYLAGSAYTFNPDKTFLPGERVTVTIPSVVQHIGGVQGTRATVWSFTAATGEPTGPIRPLWTEPGTGAQTRSIMFTNGSGSHHGHYVFEGNYNQPNKVWAADSALGMRLLWTESGTGSATVGIAAADFDGDGDIDMFEGNNAQPNRVWRRNNSGPYVFGAGWLQPSGTTATLSVAAGDLDGDGDIDIAEGTDGQGTFVWLNNGAGTFTAGWSQTQNTGATRSIAIADVDNDGDLDLVEGNDAGPLRVLLNNGSAVFTDGWEQSAPFSTTASIAVEDFNSDGFADIFEARYGSPHRLWSNDGSGQFAVAWSDSGTGRPTRAVAAGDTDGDGDMDVLEGNDGTPVRLLANNGTGAFAATWSADEASSTYAVALGALDTDADLDMMAGNNNAPNHVWKPEAIWLYLAQVDPVEPRSGEPAVLTIQARHEGLFAYAMPQDTVIEIHRTTDPSGTVVFDVTHATIHAGQSSTTITVTLVNPTAAPRFIYYRFFFEEGPVQPIAGFFRLGPNQEPTFSVPGSLTVHEDASTTLTISQLHDVEQPVTALTVTLLSGNTTLLPQSGIAAPGTTATTMVFGITPAPELSGTQTLLLQVYDGVNTVTRSLSLTVLPVNDPPSFVTATDATITVEENSGSRSFPAWATHIRPGPANESSQTLQFVVAAERPELFAVQPAVSPAGTLSFTPRPGQVGTTLVRVVLRDNGGTANGGRNTSDTLTFAIVLYPAPPVALRARVLPAPVASGGTAIVQVDAVSPGGHPSPVTQATVVELAWNDEWLALSTGSVLVAIPAGETTATVALSPFNSSTATVTLALAVRDISGALLPTTASLVVRDAVPQAFTAVLEGPMVHLSWLPPQAEDITGYVVYRSTGDAVVELTTTPPASTFYTDTSVEQGQTYAYVVRTLSGERRSAATLPQTVTVPKLTLTSPNGGEQWRFGETRMLTWNSDGSIPTVRLEYSVDNGAGWNDIAVATNTGSYAWILPPVVSTEARVRIRGAGVADVSDAAFALQPVTTLTIVAVTTSASVSYCAETPQPVFLHMFIADPVLPATSLVVTTLSSDQAIIADGDIAQQGSTSSAITLTATPRATTSGSVVLTLQVSNGTTTATATVPVTVVVYPRPMTTISSSTSAAYACGIVHYSVPATPGAIYQWGVVGGQIISGWGTRAIAVDWGAAGNGRVMVDVRTNQCMASGIRTEVIQDLFPVAIHASGPTHLCPGTSVQLTAVMSSSAGVSYVWSNGATTPSIQVSTGGVYTVTAVNAFGCTRTTSVTVVATPGVVVEDGEDLVLCAGYADMLSPKVTAPAGIASFAWSPVEGLMHPHSLTPLALATTSTVYTLTVTDVYGCSSSAQVRVVVPPPIEPTISPRTFVCEGGSAQLEATGGVEYVWSPTTGLDNPYSASPIVRPTVSDTYTVRITNAYGCYTRRSVVVEVVPSFTPEARGDTTCAGSSAHLWAAGPDSAQYRWYPEEGIDNPFSATPVVTTTATTMYTVEITSPGGCVMSTSVWVRIVPPLLDLHVLLEGAAYIGGMSTQLAAQGLLPFNHPFGGAPFYQPEGETLAFYGNDSSIVDWVLVELRAADATTPIARRPALVRSDGQVLDPEGGLLRFSGLAVIDTMYVVVWHRNHLGVMSAVPIGTPSQDCIALVDFTASPTAAYSVFADGETALASGEYGMIVGDALSDGVVNAIDRVMVRNATGATGYLSADLSLDGIVGAMDRILARRHTARSTQVP